MSCSGEDERLLKWVKPDGTDVDFKGRVHVVYINEQLRLIFKHIEKIDQGTWTCCLDNNESEGEKFE